MPPIPSLAPSPVKGAIPGAGGELRAPPPRVAPPPPEKPDPILAKAGFNHGGVNEFNKRVEAAAAAHKQATGQLPSKGLVLDIVRSSVPPDAYPHLFRYPTIDSARAHATVAKDKRDDPDDYFVTRPDGVVQPDNPIRRMITQVVASPLEVADISTRNVAGTSGFVPQSPQQQADALQKRYPMVVQGSLPIPSFHELLHALGVLNAPADSTTFRSPVLSPAQQQMKEYGTQGLSPAQMEKLGMPPEQAVRQGGLSNAVTTVKQAQTELNKTMGTTLPVTGSFNEDWVRALATWTRSADYFRKQLAYDAKNAGFGPNTHAYVKAWQAKQDTLRQHASFGAFLQGMPLGLFGHGGIWGALAAVPGYLKGQSNNPLDVGLHSLSRSAGLTLDTVGGTVQEAKAAAAAGNALTADLTAKADGKQVTLEQMKADTHAMLIAHPSWLRVLLGPDMPTQPKGALKLIDDVSNLAGDLVLLRKPAFTGERVAAGSLAAAKGSSYLNAASKWAYNDLAKYGRNGIGRAASRLEGGQGARALVSYAAPLVERGLMSPDQFGQHVAELYANGKTTISLGGGAEVTGPLLNTLRSEKLPTPGTGGRAWLQSKSFTRGWLDSFDSGDGALRAISTDRTQSFVQSVRSAVAHATVPRLGMFDEALPERLFNFVIKHKLGDDTAALANKLESDLVRFQGRQNVVGITRVQEQLRKLYHDRYPGRAGMPGDPFEATIATEAPSVFSFPGGGEREVQNTWDAIANNATRANALLNKGAMYHARVILSGLNPLTGFGGFSLFWKHAVGDTLRAEIGGGGFLSRFFNDVRSGEKEIRAYANSNPEASRRLGAFMQRATMGETRWLLNHGGQAVLARSFSTGEQFSRRNYMETAGAYLRRHLDTDTLQAYQAGPEALTEFVLHDRATRGVWKAAKRTNPDMTAEDFAALIAGRYQPIEEALAAHGLTFDDAADVLRANRGAKADTALGKFIAKNGIDFEVYKGLVEQRGTFDDLTGRWIGKVVMRPNKWNRGRFAENQLANTYAELRKAGWEQGPALDTAASVAGALTKYHMLDFANRLQYEQDLRWLSYFQTKHRLYSKWVLGTFLRRPGIAAAVGDISKQLDQNGAIPLEIGGVKLQIPAERLVWVPGREYDETSPLALGVYNFLKGGGGIRGLEQAVTGAQGTSGNILTRSDTAVVLGLKALRAKTYTAATSGLDPATTRKVNQALNDYQLSYFADHGRYAPEADAVQHVLWHQLAREYWRANLPLPVLPAAADRTAQQVLLGQFMQLRDPKDRRKFFDDHPGFADHFGVYDSPNVYLHNREFFGKFNAAHDGYLQARADILARARAGGMTTDLILEKRALDTRFRKLFDGLLVADAQQSGVKIEPGKVPDGRYTPYGRWGKLVSADPQINPTHFLNALFPKLKTEGHVIGVLQRQLRDELAHLNDPTVVATFQDPSEVRTRRREILQALDAFRAYPTDALGQVQLDYQREHVGPYFKSSDDRYKALQNMPRDQQNAAWAAYRAWRDAQDYPVVVDGVKFPSPVRMAWATLDPQTRQDRLARLAASGFDHLADYELDLLDVKHPANVSTALAAIEKAKSEYAKANPGGRITSQQLLQVAKQVDKQPGYQGFYAYYVNVLQQPKIRRFEMTSLYRDMPARLKGEFDRYIGAPAKQLARAAAAGDGNFYRATWRKAVEEQVLPWLDNPENKALKDYLARFGPDFLTTLPSR